MPGVTFFCVFVRPETNRRGGGLGRTRVKILGTFDFFFFCICSCKITCKPMGNSTENLNLGKLLPAPLFRCGGGEDVGI